MPIEIIFGGVRAKCNGFVWTCEDATRKDLLDMTLGEYPGPSVPDVDVEALHRAQAFLPKSIEVVKIEYVEADDVPGRVY